MYTVIFIDVLLLPFPYLFLHYILNSEIHFGLQECKNSFNARVGCESLGWAYPGDYDRINCAVRIYTL